MERDDAGVSRWGRSAERVVAMTRTDDALQALTRLEAAGANLRGRLTDPEWATDEPADRAAAAFEVARAMRRQCDALSTALLEESLERGVPPRVLDFIDPDDARG
jgi:hypothetical protein